MTDVDLSFEVLLLRQKGLRKNMSSRVKHGRNFFKAVILSCKERSVVVQTLAPPRELNSLVKIHKRLYFVKSQLLLSNRAKARRKEWDNGY